MEKEVISKYGRSITVHHKRRIQYNKGDILGNNITFLEEVEPDTRLKSKSSKKLVNFRKALFQCYCGKKFTARIDIIKMKKVKSCGCLQLEKLKEYHIKREGIMKYNERIERLKKEREDAIKRRENLCRE